MWRVIQSVLVVVLLGFFRVVATELPPEIIADKYLLQAEQLFARKDYGAALDTLNNIIALQKEHCFKLPDEFHFKYAYVALSADSTEIARDSVNQYLMTAGKKGKFYKKALALLVKTEQDRKKMQEKNGHRVDQKENETTQKGIYKDTKKNYQWVIRWKDRDIEKGAYKDGKMYGYWVIRFMDGNVWEGSFVDDKMHGHWVIRYADGNVEEGPFMNDKKHGHWVIRYADRDIEEGPFEDDKKHGYWVLRRNGNIEEGAFVDGKKHGIWTIRYVDGSFKKETYVNGEP